MKTGIVVYTAITNRRDALRDDQNAQGAEFWAFVDQPWGSKVWQEKPAYQRFFSQRRNARIHKILAHQFIDAEYSIWIDGNVSLQASARELIETWLADCDVAAFRHRSRRCTYVEAAVCYDKDLDDPAVIEGQVGKYRAEGLARDGGLAETTVVLRRHTRRVEDFNNAWWSELCRHSVRDQIGIMYAAQRSGLKVGMITPTKFENNCFDIYRRPPGLETWRDDACVPMLHEA